MEILGNHVRLVDRTVCYEPVAEEVSAASLYASQRAEFQIATLCWRDPVPVRCRECLTWAHQRDERGCHTSFAVSFGYSSTLSSSCLSLALNSFHVRHILGLHGGHGAVMLTATATGVATSSCIRHPEVRKVLLVMSVDASERTRCLVKRQTSCFEICALFNKRWRATEWEIQFKPKV